MSKKLIFSKRILVLFLWVQIHYLSVGQQVVIDTAQKFQVIDGFGAHQGNADVNQNWWQNLFFDDIEASIYRVDLTPVLRSPYSDLRVYSPWFMGSATKSVFNLEDPANPNGPEGNRVRTYTGPNDYSRLFGGRNAPIAVMGPQIDQNIQYFVYSPNAAIQTGKQKKTQLGDFKLVGSIWSPLPWVKISSGNRYPENWWPGPVINTPWPFVWGGNFAGGRLDVSNTPLQVFNDLSQGGTGPTSSLTQFARSTAAYILGYQRYHQVSFYAISIQNELNFEVYYNSATYPLSSQYIAALKAIRTEFDKHPELKDIKIMGPEDLLGGDSYGMWEYGGPVHKNLQYLRNIAQDPVAMNALDFFCIHGYADDGVSSSGANPREWDWWVNGWAASPAPGIPANVQGFKNFNKKSWMTETSGEFIDWLYPKSGFPGEGGFGVGLRIHQALTSGLESAWIYWTFTDSEGNGSVSRYGLTNQAAGINSPKYVAAKHFFKMIRPDAVRVSTSVSGINGVSASAYYHPLNKTLTIVMLNANASQVSTTIQIPGGINSLSSFTSRENQYWQNTTVPVSNRQAMIQIPAYGMVTLQGNFMLTSTEQENVKDAFGLTNLPNPFNDVSIIQFTLKESGFIQLDLVDLNGTFVKSIVKEDREEGLHVLPFNGKEYAAGVYFLALKSASHQAIHKIVIQ
jgi:O-glycosyl hydrolase